MKTPFRVSVSDLLRSPGASRRVRVEGTLSGLMTSSGGVSESDAVAVAGRIDALMEGLWLEADVTGVYTLECVRCLAPVRQPFLAEVGEQFAADIAPDSDEGYPLAGEEIDLRPLVRDAVILGIPTSPVCRRDCAGLCAHCGADLNAGACECREETGHPAFQALARLLSDRES